MEMIEINENIRVSLFKKEFTNPIELVNSSESSYMKFELNIQEAIKLIAVLSQYVEDNNGN